MTLRFSLGLGLIATVGLGLLAPSHAQAAMASCMSPEGSCTVSNDGFDMVDCMCSDGSGGGGGGGNAWAGLSEMELEPICDEQLALFCGMGPIGGIPCMDAFGSCVIDNDPQDSLTCECADGSGGGIVGGMAWAGLTDMELLAVCEAELPNFCAGAPMGLPCVIPTGSCEISNDPIDSISCVCDDGSESGFGGGNAWAGLSEPELLMICEDIAEQECGGAPPLELTCAGPLGECEISNDPVDSLQCECSNGEEHNIEGGNMWAGLSEGELLTACEVELEIGCADDPGTSSSTTTSDTDTDTDGVTTSGGQMEGTTTDDPTGGTGGGPSTTTGGNGNEGTTTGPSATDGSEDGGADGADGGSGGCSVADERDAGGWALMLLGLFGLGWRRRRAA